MNSDNTSLFNKLILLVLSLILVCLVLIVVQGYTARTLHNADAVGGEITPAVDEPAEAAVRAIPSPPARRPATNQVRAAGVLPPVPRSQVEEQPVPLPASEPFGSSVAYFNSVVGYGAAPGSSVEEIGALARAKNGEVEIFGVATLLGTPKPEVPIDLGPSCGRLNRKPVTTRHYVVNSASQLANVFVYISQGVTGKFAAPEQAVLLDQVGCMFEPYIFGLQAGQALRVRNSDPELHNVHIMPHQNREYNIAQSKKGQVNSFAFGKPELFFRIKCDVHPWMFAYGSVIEHPFFSVTDTNGAFRLPAGLPAGRYTLTAAHLKAGTLAQEFEYRPGEPKVFSFQFVVPETTQAQTSGGPKRESLRR